MKFGYLLFSLFGSLPMGVYAQEGISKDSIRLSEDSLKTISGWQNISPDFSPSYAGTKGVEVDNLMDTLKVNTNVEWKLQKPFFLPPYYTNPSPMFYGDYQTGGRISPYFYGSGSQSTLPGLGRINQASFQFRYALNDYFDIQAGVNAVKYSLPMSVGQSLGFSGALVYHPTDRFRITAFGSYTPRNLYGFNRDAYGATIGYDFTDRFGVDVGVQRYYDPQRGWQTVPVVVPHYKFNKIDLGIDVGGILFEVLRNVISDKRQGSSPVIAPLGR